MPARTKRGRGKSPCPILTHGQMIPLGSSPLLLLPTPWIESRGCCVFYREGGELGVEVQGPATPSYCTNGLASAFRAGLMLRGRPSVGGLRPRSWWVGVGLLAGGSGIWGSEVCLIPPCHKVTAFPSLPATSAWACVNLCFMFNWAVLSQAGVDLASQIAHWDHSSHCPSSRGVPNSWCSTKGRTPWTRPPSPPSLLRGSCFSHPWSDLLNAYKAQFQSSGAKPTTCFVLLPDQLVATIIWEKNTQCKSCECKFYSGSYNL